MTGTMPELSPDVAPIQKFQLLQTPRVHESEENELLSHFLLITFLRALLQNNKKIAFTACRIRPEPMHGNHAINGFHQFEHSE